MKKLLYNSIELFICASVAFLFILATVAAFKKYVGPSLAPQTTIIINIPYLLRTK